MIICVMLFLVFYGDDGDFGSSSSLISSKGVSCDILKATKLTDLAVPEFSNSFFIKVVNGLNIYFWKDPWGSDGARLMYIFPRLYALETHQDCKVNER